MMLSMLDFLKRWMKAKGFLCFCHLIHSEEITDHEMAYYLLDKYLKNHSGLN